MLRMWFSLREIRAFCRAHIFVVRFRFSNMPDGLIKPLIRYENGFARQKLCGFL